MARTAFFRGQMYDDSPFATKGDAGLERFIQAAMAKPGISVTLAPDSYQGVRFKNGFGILMQPKGKLFDSTGDESESLLLAVYETRKELERVRQATEAYVAKLAAELGPKAMQVDQAQRNLKEMQADHRYSPRIRIYDVSERAQRMPLQDITATPLIIMPELIETFPERKITVEKAIGTRQYTDETPVAWKAVRGYFTSHIFKTRKS
jgi:hypothetical protein